MLNEFHTRMVERIFEHEGTLDKFMGDGIMAYFGAPVPQSDHAARTVRCGLEMQAELVGLNAQRSARGEPPLSTGIGIHSGSVVLGDIGSPRRRDYTAIGDAVNAASRIEQLTKELGVPILVSEDTRLRAGPEFDFAPARPTSLRGRSAPLQCYVPSLRGDTVETPRSR